MNKLVIGFLLAFLFTGEALNAQSKNGLKNSNGMKDLKLTEVWDKVFPQSNKVEHRKVTFVNRYGITLAADMYTDHLEPLKNKSQVCMLRQWQNGDF